MTGNDTAEGRANNRRVEIIIEHSKKLMPKREGRNLARKIRQI
jgi:hypothetical protein